MRARTPAGRARRPASTAPREPCVLMYDSPLRRKMRAGRPRSQRRRLRQATRAEHADRHRGPPHMSWRGAAVSVFVRACPCWSPEGRASPAPTRASDTSRLTPERCGQAPSPKRNKPACDLGVTHGLAMVPRAGVEPARRFLSTRPSTWRVCQFRHLGALVRRFPPNRRNLRNTVGHYSSDTAILQAKNA